MVWLLRSTLLERWKKLHDQRGRTDLVISALGSIAAHRQNVGDAAIVFALCVMLSHLNLYLERRQVLATPRNT